MRKPIMWEWVEIVLVAGVLVVVGYLLLWPDPRRMQMGLAAVGAAAVLAAGASVMSRNIVQRRKNVVRSGREWLTGPNLLTVSLFVGLGLVLSYTAPERGPLSVLHHLGIGFIVAGIVTMFWQLPEMKNFFIELAVSVMVDNKYLRKLTSLELQNMREHSIRSIFDKHVDNPKYEIHAFTTWLDRLLLEKLLPRDHAGSGLYKTDFRECIALEYTTLHRVLRQLGVAADFDVVQDMRLIRQTTVTTCRVIAPKRDYKEFGQPISGWGSDVPFLPLDERIHVVVGTNEEDAKEVVLDRSERPEGGMEYSGHVRLPFSNGTCRVWMKVVEYRPAESESWQLNAMGMLTYKIEAHVYVVDSSESLSFEGNVIGGLGLEKQTKSHLPNGITLEYDDWLLEDHAYFIWWWKTVPPNALVETVADAASKVEPNVNAS